MKIHFNSIEPFVIENRRAAAIFQTRQVFKEDVDVSPVAIDDNTSYVPWGGDNNMPYDILKLIEDDETMSTCQMFNAEVCYGSGLQYCTEQCSSGVAEEIEDFFCDNPIASLFLGECQDFKHFGFCVTAFIFNADFSRIVRIERKEACYCRFAPVDENGYSPYLIFANWRRCPQKDDMEIIPLLNPHSPLADLRERLQKKPSSYKFALVSRIPTPDSTYYPIPYYASLFKSKWYNIKQLIATAKEAKLKNSAPIKYQIEISNKYWDSLFKMEGITDRMKQKERVKKEKQQILDFLTGVENSGKVWFSTFYTNPNGDEQHDVVINKIDDSKEGGDWETDIVEAINMMCFTMRVHSNLVGSVPGKTQTNNSGSDKRELYTIAQALQKPYHDILFQPHSLLIRFNGWKGAKPEVPFIQLTTLDENRDAKHVKIE